MSVERRVLNPKQRTERVSSTEASIVLRNRILRFVEITGDRSAIELFEFDSSQEGFLYDSGLTGVRTMDKEELKEIAKKIMAEFGWNELVSRAKRRTEVDPKTYKIIPDSYTEYRKYSTKDKDLVFKRIQVIKNGALQSESWSIDGVHSQAIVAKIPLVPKPSR